jgi:trans-aconitate 2-methyltransferase
VCGFCGSTLVVNVLIYIGGPLAVALLAAAGGIGSLVLNFSVELLYVLTSIAVAVILGVVWGGLGGLDGSPAMLAEAARRLERYGDRVTFVRADLAQPLPLDRPVDAILSTATFHWIADHDVLFRNLAAVLRAGGQLVVQCGGAGCLASVEAAIRAVWPLDDAWAGPWHFATAEETRRRLEAAGFADVQAWLNDDPTALEPGEPLATFLRTVVLGAHLERLPEPEHARFVAAVAAGVPHPERPVIDFVRVNIVARRAKAAGNTR